MVLLTKIINKNLCMFFFKYNSLFRNTCKILVIFSSKTTFVNFIFNVKISILIIKDYIPLCGTSILGQNPWLFSYIISEDYQVLLSTLPLTSSMPPVLFHQVQLAPSSPIHSFLQSPACSIQHHRCRILHASLKKLEEWIFRLL